MSSIGPLETVRAEDFIEYFLFPKLNGDNNSDEKEQLEKCYKKIKEISDKFCHGYIWHKDPFQLSIRNGQSFNLLSENQSNDNGELPSHIHGITFFEDNIQDEWFIVALLFELTRQVPGLIARCCDSDGEFLLIEAADYLPDWANSDKTCSEKVFIFDGRLHLINTNEQKIELSLDKKLQMLRSNPTEHIVSDDVMSPIKERIDSYPQSIKDGLHRTTAYIPVAAAALIHHNPGYVSAAVRAFCQRDQIDMKACRAMKHFPPEQRVYTNVTFTKCLYAMLTHSNFQPDRRTGWNLPPFNDSKYKAQLLGVKLACGFEILTAQAKPSENIENSKAWHKYVESLKERGYFQSFLENSKDYTKLLQEAKEYFRLYISASSTYKEAGQDIVNTMRTIDCNYETFKELETSLQPDDDDSWMNISPEELDNMLQSRYGVKKMVNGNVDATEFTENINEFLDKKSDYTGVEMDAGAAKPVLPKRRTKKSQKSKVTIVEPNDSESGTDSPARSNHIDFNPDAFQTHVQGMLDLVIPEDSWESNSDMSDFADEADLERNMEDMSSSSKGVFKTSLNDYMDQMDRELARTTIGKSFEKRKSAANRSGDSDNFDDIENFTPVDIDVNALKNMADSYRHQLGGPGPASNLLNAMGIRLNADACVDDLNVPNT